VSGTAGDGRDEYCREIEGYLCRKNDGHLIRIVGPSFERVAGWAEKGIPLKVAFKGVDRYGRTVLAGPETAGPSGSILRGDILDVFDRGAAPWDHGDRIGVGAEPGAETAPEPEAPAPGARCRRTRSGDHPAHQLPGRRKRAELLDRQIERTVGELDAALAARERFVATRVAPLSPGWTTSTAPSWTRRRPFRIRRRWLNWNTRPSASWSPFAIGCPLTPSGGRLTAPHAGS